MCNLKLNAIDGKKNLAIYVICSFWIVVEVYIAYKFIR